MLVGNFENNPVLWVWFETFCIPRRYQFKKQIIYLYSVLVFFCWLNTLKGFAKTPAVNLLRLNTLRGGKSALNF